MKYFEKGENNEEYVSFEVELKNGEIKGKAKEYNSNGKLEYEGEYYNNYRNGQGKEYYKNGNIKSENEYINGRLWNLREYDRNKI